MAYARRWKLSVVQRAELWNRWKAGQSLNEIGRALGKDHVVIHFLLARHGGIAPAARRRSLRTRNRSWTRSLCDSIRGHDKPWDFELRRINCRPVLRRPLETTRDFGNYASPNRS